MNFRKTRKTFTYGGVIDSPWIIDVRIGIVCHRIKSVSPSVTVSAVVVTRAAAF